MNYVERLESMLKVLRRLKHEAVVDDAAYHNKAEAHRRALQHVGRAAFQTSKKCVPLILFVLAACGDASQPRDAAVQTPVAERCVKSPVNPDRCHDFGSHPSEHMWILENGDTVSVPRQLPVSAKRELTPVQRARSDAQKAMYAARAAAGTTEEFIARHGVGNIVVARYFGAYFLEHKNNENIDLSFTPTSCAKSEIDYWRKQGRKKVPLALLATCL